MTTFGATLLFVLNIVWTLVIIQAVLSWLVQFQVLNIRQPLVAQIYFGLAALFEPIYRRIRGFLPVMGGLDFSPLVLLVAIYAAQVFVQNNLLY